MPSVKPIILAMVICDMIIREVGTNKHSLIGTFNNIFANGFPCTHPSLSVYVAITEVHGRIPCELRMIALEESNVIFKLPGHVEFSGPTHVAELVFQLQQVQFARPGSYSIEFWAGDEILTSRKLNVQKIVPQPPRQ